MRGGPEQSTEHGCTPIRNSTLGGSHEAEESDHGRRGRCTNSRTIQAREGEPTRCLEGAGMASASGQVRQREAGAVQTRGHGMSESLEQRLIAFSEIAKEELVRVGLGAECLAAGKISVEVLRQAGLVARPLTVAARVLNAEYVNHVQRLRRLPNSGEDWPGAYAVGIGYQSAREWAGHLVVIVASEYLLDLTLDQAARPEHNLDLPPFLVWRVEEEFLSGNALVELRFGDLMSTYVSYKAYPDDRSFTSAPLWNTAELKPAMERVSRLWKERSHATQSE